MLSLKIVICIGFLLVSNLCADTTVFLHPIRDTMIARDRPNESQGDRGSVWGASGQFPPGGPIGVVRQALVEFDINEIPQDAIVTDVKLRFQHFFYESNGQDFVAPIVFAAAVKNVLWTETSTWNSVGGEITDYTHESATIPSASSLTDWQTEEMISIVDQWVDGTLQNLGFVVWTEGPQDLVIFYSREIGVGGQQPILEVTYRDLR